MKFRKNLTSPGRIAPICFFLLIALSPVLQGQVQEHYEAFPYSDGTWIGSGWNQRVGEWEIWKERLRPVGADETADKLATYDNIVLADEFVVMSGLFAQGGSSGGNNHRGGLAFNVQDENNKHVFRLRYSANVDNALYEIFRVVDGEWTELAGGPVEVSGTMLTLNRRYFLRVEGKGGEFRLNAFEWRDGVLNPEPLVDVTVEDGTHSGGHAGMHVDWRGVAAMWFLVQSGEGAVPPRAEDFSFRDDFDREDNSFVGDAWTLHVGDWEIVNEELHAEAAIEPMEKLITVSTPEVFVPFEIATEMRGEAQGRFGGIAFHVEGSSNYYAVRMRFTDPDVRGAEVQLLRFVDGEHGSALGTWALEVEGDMISTARPYRMVVGSPAPELLIIEVWEEKLGGEFERILHATPTATGFTTGGGAGAYNNAGQIVYSNFEMTLGSPGGDAFQLWREQYFTEAQLLDEAISGPAGDPAGDGVSNLHKFALGLDPWAPARGLLPSGDLIDGRLVLVFQWPEASPGVDILLGVSNDLVNWATHPLSEYEDVERISLGDGMEEWTVLAPSAEAGRQFSRLELRLNQ